MKIVMISSCRAVARPIIGRVLSGWPDASVVRPTWGAVEVSDAHRLARAARSPVRSSRRTYHRTLARRRDQTLKALLADVTPQQAIAPEPLPAGALNRPAGVRRLEALRPELLVLCGAPILRDGPLAIPSIGTINVHFGIAPQYRGEHTLFHALRQRDYDHLGLTIHGVDRGVDTGPLLAHATPTLAASDDETTLLAKCARLGADLLVECLGIVERNGRITGQPQSSSGRLYRRDDRRVLRHDLAEAVSREVLGRRPTPRPEQVIRYFE